MNKCLIEGCQDKKISRGLCKSHYLMMRRLVELGTRTWKEFEEAGMSAIPRLGKDNPKNIILNEMMKKKLK